ncbi:hypothetical protein [Oscillatoria sp. FACHB-1406]|uniref:hypothetical protein n=1 Tax=Oscillatoria sp. FACHB-1406 TaxID=2692846 RepID=UPI001684B694|nr:hypothetical protein [Oscillatoria sp. FACHB-1406]MBD2576597.1 hypothetical protein [Oscillatoria sp. FACHB-1406]
MAHNLNIENIEEPIAQASPEVKAIIERVLRIEKERLHQKSRKYINDDILKIVKDVVK